MTGAPGQEELRGFARERKTATLLQAAAAVVGVFLPVIAVIFYLAVSVIYLIEPFREVGVRAPRRPAEGTVIPRSGLGRPPPPQRAAQRTVAGRHRVPTSPITIRCAARWAVSGVAGQ